MGEKSKAALSDVKLYQSGASTASPASTASAASDCVRLRQTALTASTQLLAGTPAVSTR